MDDIPWISVICMVANIFVFWHIFNLERLMKASGNIRTFYVKAAFAFPDRTGYIGLCTYYSEQAIQEYLCDNGITLGELVKEYSPKFDFPINIVSHSCITKMYKLPQRVKAYETTLNKFSTIIFTQGLSVIILVKPDGKGPFETNWFGTCIQSDKEETIKKVLKEYRKQVKAGTCNISSLE